MNETNVCNISRRGERVYVLARFLCFISWFITKQCIVRFWVLIGQKSVIDSLKQQLRFILIIVAIATARCTGTGTALIINKLIKEVNLACMEGVSSVKLQFSS